MAERPTYKLRFLDPKKRFPSMPEQPAGRSYGVVWKVFGEDPKESCYVVEFVGKTHISLLGYVSVSGKVYKVDRPVREVPLPEDPDMELVLHESDSSIGEIMVREANGAMRACARTAGSPEDPMREQSDHETWNSTRALPYGEFMASMFLRYVIFANSESALANTTGVDGLDVDMQNVVDKIKLVKLPEPVEVFLGFDTAPLPDAIETLLYRVDHAENPSGIERYAAALMSEIDLPRLRTIAAKSEMSLARIDRSKLFYLNFDRSLLDQDEIDMLLAIECRLNRLSGILERIGAGLVPAASSPSLEGCALFDAWHIAKTTNDVPRLLDTASSDNPWGKPGTVACQPGGEWDVRTRFARIVEALNVVTRLDNTREAGTHIPLTARLASHRTRFAPRVIARGRIEQSGNIVGRLGDMPRIKERAALKARRGCRRGQSGPDALEDAGEAVETALDGKQHVNLALVQQATIKIEIEQLRPVDAR